MRNFANFAQSFAVESQPYGYKTVLFLGSKFDGLAERAGECHHWLCVTGGNCSEGILNLS